MKVQDLLAERYPREFELRDGGRIAVQPLKAEDEDSLYAFFQEIDERDGLYLKDDVKKREVISRWCKGIDFSSIVPLLAWQRGQIVADFTLHRSFLGWNRHVGNVRGMVHPESRGRGIGSIMVREIIAVASAAGLKKLDVELMEVQEDAIQVFESLGFHQIAELPQHVTDLSGKFHDLIILANDLRFDSSEDYFAGD